MVSSYGTVRAGFSPEQLAVNQLNKARGVVVGLQHKLLPAETEDIATDLQRILNQIDEAKRHLR